MSNYEEWTMVCRAYVKKIGAKLLFVNSDNFGFEKDGKFYHWDCYELAEHL